MPGAGLESRLLDDRLAERLSARADRARHAVERLSALRGVLEPEGKGDLAASRSMLADYADAWTDDQASELVEALAERLEAGHTLSATSLKGWLQAHSRPDELRSLIDCISVDPPAQVSILRVLSRAGSQKVVYLALWHISDQQIVLKRFIGEGSEAIKILLRELQIHPLSMQHPNVHVTHLLTSPTGEEFLAERFIEVLDDAWRAEGASEASSLLHDIAAGLEFVHGRRLVHGDVKPDNVGYENRRYLLCDFGICRPASEFANAEVTPTGSLRTRAPELLQHGEHSPAADVWALGATVFNSVVGRFPLYASGEAPPRASSPEERTRFEAELAERVSQRWEELVEAGLDAVQPSALRKILASTLALSPDDRPSAGDVARACRSELAPLVRATGQEAGLAPDLRVAQLSAYLGPPAELALMPRRVRSELVAEIARLRGTPGLSSEQHSVLRELERRLPELG